MNYEWRITFRFCDGGVQRVSVPSEVRYLQPDTVTTGLAETGMGWEFVIGYKVDLYVDNLKVT